MRPQPKSRPKSGRRRPRTEDRGPRTEPVDILAALRPELDAAIGSALSLCAGAPPRLVEAMRYALFPGGKRIRPALVLLSAEAAGGQRADALGAAAAVELIHAYSLVHDDLPAMDDDDLRRGRLSCHKAFDEATAILAGDALQALAFEALAALTPDPGRAGTLAATLARASGARGMVGGQQLDLEAEGRAHDRAGVEAIHRRKTGALLTACLTLGAQAAGAASAVVERWTRFGERIGLAFQIVDDVLDLTKTSEELGKTAGKDAAAGKATYPAAVGVEASRREAERLLAEALAEIEPIGPAAAPLRAVALHVVRRTS